MRVLHIAVQVVLIVAVLNISVFSQTAVLKDRTPHPPRASEDYIRVELEQLSNNVQHYNWAHVRFICRYREAYESGGYVLLDCEDMNGVRSDQLLITAGDTSGVSYDYFESLKSGSVLELYCLVELTHRSGETTVMIENVIEMTQCED